jgi:hypothetical protein
MNQIRSRQIARLEKRALPYIKQREGIAQQFQNLHRGAVAHAAVLAFVMRYGNPQMGEPLSEACQRVTESEAWEACCEKFPEECKNFRDRNFRVQYSFGPYNRDRVSSIGELLRHILMSRFPGADEKEKLNRVFKSAPPWLICFTFADYTAKLLDLSLPDLSNVCGFARSKEVFHGWWGLPESAFECQPWPHSANGEPLARTDLSLLGLGTRQDEAITNRERMRAHANSARSNPSRQIEWPGLISEKWLQLDFQTQISILRKAGHFGGEENRHPEFCDILTGRRRHGSY